MDTEVAKQVNEDWTITRKVEELKKELHSQGRAVEAEFQVGNHVWLYEDQAPEGVPGKMRIPYRGPYKITSKFGKAVELG